MRKIFTILAPIAICILVGVISSYIQKQSIVEWYPFINKPKLTPPNIVFPIVWSILYILMGISIGIILNKNPKNKRYFVRLFSLQLILNFIWSFFFFYLQNPLLGFINILLLDLAVLYYIIKIYKTEKVSSFLFTPYLVWIVFASYLNYYILVNN